MAPVDRMGQVLPATIDSVRSSEVHRAATDDRLRVKAHRTMAPMASDPHLPVRSRVGMWPNPLSPECFHFESADNLTHLVVTAASLPRLGPTCPRSLPNQRLITKQAMQ